MDTLPCLTVKIHWHVKALLTYSKLRHPSKHPDNPTQTRPAPKSQPGAECRPARPT